MGCVCQPWRSASHNLLGRLCTAVGLPPALPSDEGWENEVAAHPRIAASLRACISFGMTMSCPAPESTTRLNSILTSMQLMPCRSRSVQRLHLANHAADDSALGAISSLFPNLQMLTLVGGDITAAGLEQLTRGCRRIHTLVLFYCPNITV